MNREMALLLSGFVMGIFATITLFVFLACLHRPEETPKMGDDIRLGESIPAHKMLHDHARGFVAICNRKVGETRLALRTFGGFYNASGVFQPDERLDWKHYGKTWVAYTLTDFDRFEKEGEKECE